MPLDESYLTYPHRSYGMDQELYDWVPVSSREPVTLSGGIKCIANIIVPIEFFPLDPPAKPFAHPGAMKTPYPDLRHYTTRDYGNRVGVYRILKVLARAGVKATFPINAEVATRYPGLVADIQSDGHEIAAHGVSTAHIHHEGMSEDGERELVARSREVFPDAVTWMSPARNQSFRTPDLLTEHGFSVCLDWEHDNRPSALRTKNGPLICLPNLNELADFKLLVDRSQSEEDWSGQLVEAARYQIERHDVEGASSFAFTLTPYIVGLPFRIAPLEDLLETLTGMDGLSLRTASDTVAAFGGEQ